VTTGSGVGTVQFNTTGTNYFTQDGTPTGTGVSIQGATQVVNNAGYNVLFGGSTYTGRTNILGGTLADGSAHAFSPNSAVSLQSGANLNVNFDEEIGGLNSLTNGGGRVNIAEGTTLALANTGSDTFSGVIEGAGALMEAGIGMQTLTGANTYTGGTEIDNGTLAIGADNNLGAAPGSVTPGLLSLDGGTLRTISTFTLSSNRGINLGSDGGSFNTDAGTTLTYGGVIAGPGALSKLGDGTLLLTSANTYRGGTMIDQGTLAVGNNSALGTGPVLFNGGRLSVESGIVLSNPIDLTNGAVLGGNGIIGSHINVGPGVILSPGNSPGTLTFEAGLTYASGGSYDWQIESVAGTPGQSTSWDLVAVTGVDPLAITATPGSQFTIKIFSLNSAGNPGLVSDFNSGNSYSWTIASATSTGGITGFNASDFSIDISDFQNSLNGGGLFLTSDGTNLMMNFTPVPEPSTYVLMAAGLVVLLWQRRRILRRKPVL
jgi:autotransporter-associated beta strand protein